MISGEQLVKTLRMRNNKKGYNQTYNVKHYFRAYLSLNFYCKISFFKINKITVDAS